VSWMWIGGFVMVVGTVIAIWPERRPQMAVPRRVAGSAVTTSAEETPL
jgi:cytochrome c biogenesis factor